MTRSLKSFIILKRLWFPANSGGGLSACHKIHSTIHLYLLQVLLVFTILPLQAYGSSSPDCSTQNVSILQSKGVYKFLKLNSNTSKLKSITAQCGTKTATLKYNKNALKAALKADSKLCKAGDKSMCKSAKIQLTALTKVIVKSAKLKTQCKNKKISISNTIKKLKHELKVIKGLLQACDIPFVLPVTAPTPTATPTPNAPQPVQAPKQCDDGIDNDGDGLVDSALDPGCVDGNDDSEDSEGEQLADEVSQWGITFKFDKPYHTGKFANGDFWVAPFEQGGIVTLVAITPDAQGGLNGFEVNPSRSLHPGQQAFDYRANLYNPQLLPSLPLQAKAGDSIIKAISDSTFCSYPVSLQCLKVAAVLTVLDEVPAQRGALFFRPPYVKGDKALVSINNIRWDLLPSLVPPSGVDIPSLSDLAAEIAPVNIDHLYAHDARARPKTSPWYGANISARNMEIILRLFLNDTQQQKKQLMINFLNYSLDMYAFLLDGQTWQAAGGHGHRGAVISFGAAMFQNDDMVQALNAAPSWTFGETDATYISPVTGLALYGELNSGCTELNYWQAINSPTSYNACRDPYPSETPGQIGGQIDGGRFPGGGYQTCCSSPQWQATYTAIELMPALKEAWHPAAFMQYVKRFLKYGARTQGDICAPGRGTCLGGDHDGQLCSTANAASLCTGMQSNGKAAKCELDFSQYGVTFGPKPGEPGHCILDTDPSDGIGRFPQNEGLAQGSTWGQTAFQVKMRELYLNLN